MFQDYKNNIMYTCFYDFLYVSFMVHPKATEFYGFLIDTGMVENVVPEWFLERYIPTGEKPQSCSMIPTDFIYPDSPPVKIPSPKYSKGKYTEVESKKIKCCDGENRICRGFKVIFFIDDKKHSAIFYLDKSFPKYYEYTYVIGLVGIHFLKKENGLLTSKIKQLHKITKPLKD